MMRKNWISLSWTSWVSRVGLLFFAALLLHAISPILAKTDNHLMDARHLYVSGTIWASGKSPYHADIYIDAWKEKMAGEAYRPELYGPQGGDAAHLYPPTLGAVTLISALFPDWTSAKIYLQVVNLLFLLLTLVLLFRLIVYCKNGTIPLSIFYWMGLGCIVSAISSTMYLGQTSIIALAGCVGALYFSMRDRFFIASVFIFLASIKPHYSIFLILFIFLQQKDWRLLAYSCATIFPFVIVMLIYSGDINPIPEIIDRVANYTNQGGPNTPSDLTGFIYLWPYSRVLPILLGITLTTIFSIIVRVGLSKKGLGFGDDQVKVIIVLAASLVFCITSFFSTLHAYDHTLFLFVAASAALMAVRISIILLPGFLLVSRPGNVSDLVDRYANFLIQENLLSSMGSIYVLVGLTVMLVYSNVFASNRRCINLD